MRGKDASDTQVSASFTNYGTYTELTAGNVGYSFFINNSRSAGTKIGFGNGKTSNDKVIVYTANNTLDLRPGSTSVLMGDYMWPILPNTCLLYTSPSPRDRQKSRMPSSA